jgi:DNA-binding CsgD family transcriptional regulator
MSIVLEYMITAIVCLITAIVIQRIYKKEKRRAPSNKGIKGITWFGLAIFIWGFGALINLIAVFGLGWSPSNRILIYWGVVISLLNSMFILLSLPSIEYMGQRGILIRLVERFSEREFMSIYLGVMVMLSFVFFAASYTNPAISSSLIWLIDIPISIVVAFALLSALNKAFKNRNMRFMYLPSFSLFVLIIIAVTHRIVPVDAIPVAIGIDSWNLLGTVTSISFKFLFILLFSILLYSWKFLSEKEEQQFQLEELISERESLEKSNEKLILQNQGYLKDFTRIKEELNSLKEATKIELSDRQKEVLGNLGALGSKKSYTEIAEAMHISLDGFQTHVHQIKKALHISGTAGKNLLITYAIENDMLQYATLDSE